MPEEGPCPDLVGKYLIYYKEGEQAPLPVPEKGCVLFKVIARSKEEFSRFWPRTRWPHGSGYM